MFSDKMLAAGSRLFLENWLISSPAQGYWAGKENSIAFFLNGNWIFAAPQQGMRIFDNFAGQFMHFDGDWKISTLPASPQGRSVIDVEARAAIDELIQTLQTSRILQRD